MITEYPSDDDDRSSSISEDDHVEVDEVMDPLSVICCETNDHPTLVPPNKQHDSAGMREQLEHSCLARNLCCNKVVYQIIDRRLLQFLTAGAILKSVRKQGRMSAAKDPAVNRHYATIQTLSLFKSEDVLLGFYKTFFATNEEAPLQLDPEGMMLAFFHPSYKHGGNMEATSNFL